MKGWLSVAFGATLALIVMPPFFVGSNHTCPALRQRDLDNGPNAQAIPPFARKYGVDCTYCHTAFPQLNRQGYIFRRLGYRMPWEVPMSHPSAAPTTTQAPPTPTAAPAAPITAPAATAGTPAVPPAVASGLKEAVGKQPPSPEKIAAGQKVFEQMQCFTCHVNGGNVINPSKPIKGADFAKKYPTDEQIAQIIRHGVAGTAMPAYDKDRLSDAQLDPLIAYIRSLTP